MLDAGAAKQLTQAQSSSDTPGFTAKIEAGSSPNGPFKPISGLAGRRRQRRTFSLKGDPAQYYVVWITNLGTNSSVARQRGASGS